MSDPGRRRDEPAWRLLGTRPPKCAFGTHRRPASLDESERRLSHSELAVAELLVKEGHQVRSVAERPGQGRVADLEACGQSVEVKTWLAPAGRGGRPATARSVFNKLNDARGQGATAVLWARGSGLAPLDAARGVEEFVGAGRFDGIAAVRVVGDGFDLAWGAPGPDLGAGRHRGPAVGSVGAEASVAPVAAGGGLRPGAAESHSVPERPVRHRPGPDLCLGR